MWTFRDIRSVAVNDRLHREFNGAYESQTRLWTFPTRTQAEDAEALVQQQHIHVLHVPGGAGLWSTLTSTRFGGVAISAWHADARKQRHNSVTVVYTDEDHFHDARRAAMAALRTTERLEDAERAFGLRADVMPFQDRETLQHRYAAGLVTVYEHEELEARLCAAAQRRPRNAAAEESSLRDAFRAADDWIEAQDRRLPHRTAHEDDLANSTVEGVLVGRSDCHLVVDAGTELIALRSDRIATGRAYNGVRERAFDVRSPINIAFDERAVGHCIQNRERADLDIGLLRLAGVRAAEQEHLQDILMVDDLYRGTYDLQGTVVAKRGAFAAVYDRAAYVTLLMAAEAEVGQTIRRGPRAPQQRSRTH